MLNSLVTGSSLWLSTASLAAASFWVLAVQPAPASDGDPLSSLTRCVGRVAPSAVLAPPAPRCQPAPLR